MPDTARRVDRSTWPDGTALEAVGSHGRLEGGAPPWHSARVIEELPPGEVEALLREQVVGRVGCHAGGLTYVVPVIYAYARGGGGDGGGAIYVATIEGQKVRMMRENPQVCFEVDEYERGSWRSAIVQGLYEELEGEEAERALALLAARFGRTAGESGVRRSRPGRATVCFRIVVREATGRAVAR